MANEFKAYDHLNIVEIIGTQLIVSVYVFFSNISNFFEKKLGGKNIFTTKFQKSRFRFKKEPFFIYVVGSSDSGVFIWAYDRHITVLKPGFWRK